MKLSKIFAAAVLAALSFGAAAQTPFYGQRETLFEVLPVDSSNIVMLGNSLTNGCEWSELFGNPKILNRGISGDVIPGMINRLSSITDGKPAKIFVMGGVNDVSHHLTTDSIAGDMATLLDRIHALSPNTKIYLQSLLPIRQQYDRYHGLDGKEGQIRELNERYKALAAERNIPFIDLYSLMADEEGNLKAELTNDGLHLEGPAYMIWREAILPYINE